LVDRTLNDVPQDSARAYIRRGWEQLAVAKPIQPESSKNFLPGHVDDHLEKGKESSKNFLPAEDQPMGEDSGGHSVAGKVDDVPEPNDVSCTMEFEQAPKVYELAADVTILDTGRKTRKRSKLMGQ
jgi:hypothetical protein